jgi:tetratricopeptide (TPR) repeat protein
MIRISDFTGLSFSNPCSRRAVWIYVAVACSLILSLSIAVQHQLDQRFDGIRLKLEGLNRLPSGEYLKPALLGYHHLGADVIWLQVIQVLGSKRVSAEEYEWMAHALDVITTLDQHYAYAYYAGGVVLTDLGNRVDLSNQLLEKGFRANPTIWNIPFLLGYNHYFILGNATTAADYIAAAARLPGGPAYLPGLATRMYAEANNPEVALEFLELLRKQTKDREMREVLEKRAKEVIIERDIKILESAVDRYRNSLSESPHKLEDLVRAEIISGIPKEPFGGSYEFDPTTGKISSTTHPNRLRVFRLDKEGGVTKGPYGIFR